MRLDARVGPCVLGVFGQNMGRCLVEQRCERRTLAVRAMNSAIYPEKAVDPHGHLPRLLTTTQPVNVDMQRGVAAFHKRWTGMLRVRAVENRLAKMACSP